jgi:hypothetical protein
MAGFCTIPKSTILFCPRNRSGVFKVPATITTIGAYAFDGCEKITAFDFSSAPNLETLGEGAFSRTGLTTLVIPKSVKTIGPGLLQDVATLTTLSFEKGIGITTIPASAFEGTSITTLELPKSVRTLERLSFKQVRLLKTLTYEPGTELATIDTEVFWSTGLTSFTIPPKLTVLNPGNFFESPNLTKLVIEPGNTSFILDRDRVLLDKMKATVLFALRDIQEYGVPPSIRTIGGYAFYQCSQLQKIEIDSSSNLEVLGRFAFGFSAIRGIHIPPRVKIIENDCFANCAQLTAVRFHANSVLESSATGRLGSLKSTSLLRHRRSSRLASLSLRAPPSPRPVSRHPYRLSLNWPSATARSWTR